MNNNRRKQLGLIFNQLEDCLHDIEIISDEEQNALDNMPESLQCTERGQQMQECIDAMESAKENISSAMSEIEEIICDA